MQHVTCIRFGWYGCKLYRKRITIILCKIYIKRRKFKISSHVQDDKIKKQKYPAEFHHVQTDDGYIVGIHRLPKHPSAPNYQGVMFLMHGLGAASPCYVVYPNISAG